MSKVFAKNLSSKQVMATDGTEIGVLHNMVMDIKTSSLLSLVVKPDMALDASKFQNDVEMLRAAGFSIAVNNAEDAIKESADMVTKASFGDGTVEAIEYLLSKGWL